MNATIVPKLYMRLRKRVHIHKGQTIRLRDIAQLIIEPGYEQEVSKLVLHTHSAGEGNLVLIDMMRIIAKVKERFPQMEVECLGQPHVIIEAGTRSRKPNFLLLALVWALLFLGSALAIMNFHADVSMMEVHQRIAEMITGRRPEHPYLLQIPYSIGIGLGMVLFFNRMFKKKFNEEPSPLEVEMYLYQENINQYVVSEEYGKMQAEQDRQLQQKNGLPPRMKL